MEERVTEEMWQEFLEFTVAEKEGYWPAIRKLLRRKH